ncbi:TonB-dependent receptor [Stakelama pacifica]|uniref:Catecholate siderophore receptor n=1 Tax=Stakelama pacifica TaxID=517720 RepID=A0A4R6F9P1_9SPHN|nr:TonB-dependent siderophore receptor [Stakelama pacifica]TDN77763.1 catecholate siderophore receptor [Stakelama pacifica]GGP00836.1 iron transport outer membrane receptor [Stakelama pacifica]
MARATTGRSAGFVALGCVGFVASVAAPAHAQDAQKNPTQLQGVTVTDAGIDEDAYKVDAISSPKATASLLDTPRTINIVTDKVLQDTASFSLEDALRTVPGITLGAGEGGVASADIPLIRGVDATGSTFVDGARDIGSQTRETFALERIEVFKGANSALDGRGSAGGAINLVTKTAHAGTSMNASGTIGTDNFYRVTGDVNTEIADKLAARVVAMYHNADVAGRDAVFDKRWGVAPSITYGVGTPITATFAYYHYETDAMPDYGIPLTSRGQLSGDRREPADVDHDNFYGLKDRDFQKTRVDSASFIFRADLGGGWGMANTTRYSNNRNDYIVTNPDDSAGNVANGYVWRNTKSRNSLNEGIVSNTNFSGVFDTGGIGHSVSFGGELSVSDSTNRNYSVDTGNFRAGSGDDCATAGLASYNCTTLDNPNPNDPWAGSITPSATPNRASAEDYSLYAFDTVTIVPQLLLNGGLRWTSYSVKASGSGRGGSYSAESSTDFWTWQAGALFKPTEASSLYFSYANSKTPPGSDVGEGSNNLGSGNAYYEPSTTKNWEIGGKMELFNGGLLLTAAAFRAERGNIQENDPIAGPIFIADKARLQGFELGATGMIGPVSIIAGYTLVDSDLRDGSENDGNALPNTPKHNVAVTVNWDVTPRITIGGGAYGASKRYADTANLIRADGYVRFDANAAYRISDALSVRVNLRNVGDERYITKLRNPHFAVPAAGRQALLTLSASY